MGRIIYCSKRNGQVGSNDRSQTRIKGLYKVFGCQVEDRNPRMGIVDLKWNSKRTTAGYQFIVLAIITIL